MWLRRAAYAHPFILEDHPFILEDHGSGPSSRPAAAASPADNAAALGDDCIARMMCKINAAGLDPGPRNDSRGPLRSQRFIGGGRRNSTGLADVFKRETFLGPWEG